MRPAKDPANRNDLRIDAEGPVDRGDRAVESATYPEARAK